MKSRKILLLLAILSFSVISYGQKDFKHGYVITNDNDTLYGTIDLKSNYKNSRTCNFLSDSDPTSKEFGPGDIKAYRIDIKYYVSRELELDKIKQRAFLEFLVDGIVDLYYLKESDREYYFIEKDGSLILLSNDEKKIIVESSIASGKDDKVYSTNSNQYIGMLKYLFQDSPEAMQEIPKTRFDYKPLINLTKDYHNSVCKDYNCIDYTKSTKTTIYIEPGIGMINSWMGLKTSDDHAYDLNPYFGLMFRLKGAKRFYLWNFLTGLNYSFVEFRGDFENSLYYTIWQPTELHHIYLKYSYLSLPLSVDYSLPFKKIQPYFSASFNNIFILNSEYEVHKFDNTVPEKTTFRKYQIGLAAGLGLKYILKNGSYFSLNTGFEYRFPSANFNWVLDFYRVYSWNIGLGYGFRL
jgi:hypothetical protein